METDRTLEDALTAEGLGNTATEPGPPESVKTLAPGTRIHQYQILRELGRGGMGTVYAARDTKLARRVALKVLHHTTGTIAQRFMIEARATAQCTHENIVVIHEVGEYEGTPFMVLEYLDGQPLRARMMPSSPRTPASRVIEIMLPVARALARAANLGIVHRDLKPENVFITNAGTVKVLDFGIAKAQGTIEHSVQTLRRFAGPEGVSFAKGLGDSSLTAAGMLLGTVPYMSPEQLGAGGDVDARSDVWAAGIMMYELLAGRHPVEPLSVTAVFEEVCSAEPLRPIAEVVPGTPPPLAKLVDLCLRKTKEDRMASAAELARRLEELLPGRRGRSLDPGESPFPGLTAFQEHDADRFFGRTRDVARMVAMVRDLPLTAVVGPSGVGKSSFVRAGLAPQLQASGENWELLSLRPGRHPIAALASVVERLALRDTRAGQQITPPSHDALEQRIRAEPGFLGAQLRSRVRDTTHNILLFVDQFEELYTLVHDLAERRAFTAALAGAADDTASPLRVVLSLRADFLDRLGEDPRFLDEVSRGLLVLGVIDRAGLRDALVRPLEMVEYSLESPSIVDEMLDELQSTAGALPLLQFIASKLWDARDEQRRQLTEAAYRASGGVLGALAAHADQVVASLSAPSRALAPEIFRNLVTPERTRAVTELDDLARLSQDPTLVGKVVEQLVTARLLVVQRREGAGATVEIVHEALIDRWPALRRWLDEGQEDAAFLAQLSVAAKQWDARGRVAGLLWRGEAADEARRWSAHRRRALPERDEAFVAAVLDLDRRTRRNKRRLLVGAFAGLVAIAAGASFALVTVRAAQKDAETNARAARSALDARTTEERARHEAEDKRAAALAALLDAEQRRKAAEAGLLSAEEAAVAANDAKRAAEKQAAAAAATLDSAAQLTRDELFAKNEELASALASASAARERAEKATAKAELLAGEATKAKAALQQALAVEKARAEKLEQFKREVSTKLK